MSCNCNKPKRCCCPNPTSVTRTEFYEYKNDMNINLSSINHDLSVKELEIKRVELAAEKLKIEKQDKLTAGENITIDENNVISSTGGGGETYTAGANIQISDDNVISATDTTYTAGTNIQINDENVISAIVDLSDYYDKTEVDDLLAGIEGLHMEVVSALPATGASNVIYLLEQPGGGYEEWIYSNGQWVDIGSASIDLSDYYTKTETDELFSESQRKAFKQLDPVPNGANLNNYKENGYHWIGVNTGVSNAPEDIATGHAMALEVYTVTGDGMNNGQVVQKIYAVYDSGTAAQEYKEYFRRLSGNPGPPDQREWSNWYKVSDEAEIHEELDKAVKDMGSLPATGGDLDTVTERGYYNIANSAVLAHDPIGQYYRRMLEVYPLAGGGVILQKISAYTDRLDGSTQLPDYIEYVRYQYAKQEGGQWTREWSDWTPAAEGKNANADINKIKYPYNFQKVRNPGDEVSFNVTSDGSITVRGTIETANGIVALQQQTDDNMIDLEPGRYYILYGAGTRISLQLLAGATMASAVPKGVSTLTNPLVFAAEPGMRYFVQMVLPASGTVMEDTVMPVLEAGEKEHGYIRGAQDSEKNIDELVRRANEDNTEMTSIDGKTMRVMSYNVACWRKDGSKRADGTWINPEISTAKIDNLKRLLSNTGADLVCGQEDLPYLDAPNGGDDITSGTKSAVEYVWGDQYSTNYVNNVVLKGLHYNSAVNDTGGQALGQGGGFVVAKKRIGDKWLWMFSVHLTGAAGETGTANRRLELDALWTYISSKVGANDYLVIGGDFNTRVSDSEDPEKNDRMQLAAWCRTNNLQMANGGFVGWIQTSPSGRTLDNIIVNKNVRIDGFRALKSWYPDLYSDHCPVVADLTLLGTESETVERYAQTPNYMLGANLKERFGTAEAFAMALRGEQYNKFFVGDYWPVTLNGTFRDYGSYTVPSGVTYYSDAALTTEAGTTSATAEGQYQSATAVKFKAGGADVYCAIGDCLDYFERTLTNVIVNLEIAGINPFWGVGNDGLNMYPHVMFASRDCLSGVVTRMRKANDVWETPAETNPWRGSALFKTLNDPDYGLVKIVEGTDIGAFIKSGVRAMVEYKPAGTAVATSANWRERGSLFVPFEREVWGTSIWGGSRFNGGLMATQLPLFNGTARHIVKMNGTAKSHWWCASSVDDDNIRFCYVNGNGFPGYNHAVDQYGIPVCFVMA